MRTESLPLLKCLLRRIIKCILRVLAPFVWNANRAGLMFALAPRLSPTIAVNKTIIIKVISAHVLHPEDNTPTGNTVRLSIHSASPPPCLGFDGA